MKRIVLVFGLISGAVMSVLMIVTMMFHDQIGFTNRGLIVGYASMVLAFLMVYFGVRTYRDTVNGGTITFAKGFLVGLCIMLVASACYVATWEVLSHRMFPDFAAKYSAHEIEKVRAAGAPQAEIEAKARDMARFQEMYRNPLINIALTFLEPLPVGLLFTLGSAWMLRRRRAAV
jgi:hypothetical protein